MKLKRDIFLPKLRDESCLEVLLRKETSRDEHLIALGRREIGYIIAI